jgi:hypothetical protein
VAAGIRSIISRERCWLLGPAAMRDLGLPYRPPWYGISRVLTNLVISQGLGRLPGGRPMLLARAERQAQAQFRHWESLAV